jgi:hypothetical protein
MLRFFASLRMTQGERRTDLKVCPYRGGVGLRDEPGYRALRPDHCKGPLPGSVATHCSPGYLGSNKGSGMQGHTVEKDVVERGPKEANDGHLGFSVDRENVKNELPGFK